MVCSPSLSTTYEPLGSALRCFKKAKQSLEAQRMTSYSLSEKDVALITEGLGVKTSSDVVDT